MIDDLIKESGLADEWIAEGEQRLAKKALERRFGPLSADLLAAIQKADEVILLDLVSHISTETLAQVYGRGWA